MIHDVDAALEALVRRDALNGTRVEVLFDAPTKDWVARRNAPTVDLYLYDIREELNRREVAWEDVRDEGGRVTERRPPARRFRLSYLVTVWTQRPEDEHRLLSGCLATFVANETIPGDLLGGALADLPVPVILNVALPPTEDRSIADVWSALGGELKPSLDVQVIAPLDVRRTQQAGPPVLAEPTLDVRAPEVEAERTRRVRSGLGGRPGRGGPLSPDEPAHQDETVAGGHGPGRSRVPPVGERERDSMPGRRIHLRGIPRP